jgi:DNA-directed RNA polymerase specialized sigma24 family protein
MGTMRNDTELIRAYAEQRVAHEEDAAMINAAASETPQASDNRRAAIDELDREIAALPKRLRQAVVLRYLGRA